LNDLRRVIGTPLARRAWCGFAVALALLVVGPADARDAGHRPEASCPFPSGCTTRDSVRLLLLGEYVPAATEIAARDLASTERRYGRDARETVEPLLLLAEAGILCEGTRRAEGVALLDRVERIDRRRGIRPFERAAIERLRGIALYRESHYDSSLVHFVRAESLISAVGGAASPDQAVTLLWHGRALQSARRNNVEAAPILQRADSIVAVSLGRESALAYLVLEKYAAPPLDVWPGGTLERLTRTLAGLQNTIGPEAPRLIFTYFGIVNLHSTLGNTAEAKRFVGEGLAVAEANDGDCVLGAAYMYDAAASIAGSEGDHALSDSFWTKCLEVVTRTRPADDPSAVFSRTNRAAQRFAMGRIDEAEAEWRALDPVIRAVWGDSSDMQAQNTYFLGLSAMAHGDTARARTPRAQLARLSRLSPAQRTRGPLARDELRRHRPRDLPLAARGCRRRVRFGAPRRARQS
jgi:hypothetical protein